jgi:hypothetical protein
MNDLLGIVMLVSGFFIAVKVFGSNYNLVLFFSSVIFLMGVELLVLNNFDLLLPYNFPFMIFFVISGGGLIILYINNLKKYFYLLGALSSIFTGWLFLKILPPINIQFPYLFFSERAKIIWIVIFLAAGIILWLNLRKDQSAEE